MCIRDRLSAECVDLDEEPPENLLSFDVIELMGGNPFYLLKRMKETNCVPVLQTLAAEKTVIGVSAGSLVLQASIELAAGFTPEMNRGVGLSGLSGLGLTQLEIFPHYHKFLPRFDRLEAVSYTHLDVYKRQLQLGDKLGKIGDVKQSWQVLQGKTHTV